MPVHFSDILHDFWQLPALEFLGRWQRRTRNAGDGCRSWICTSEQWPRTLKKQTCIYFICSPREVAANMKYHRVKGQIHWTCSFGGYRNKNWDLGSMLWTWLCNGLPGFLSSSQSFQKLIEKDVKWRNTWFSSLPSACQTISDYPPLETRYRWNTFQTFSQAINCNISKSAKCSCFQFLDSVQPLQVLGSLRRTPGSGHDVNATQCWPHRLMCQMTTHLNHLH